MIDNSDETGNSRNWFVLASWFLTALLMQVLFWIYSMPGPQLAGSHGYVNTMVGNSVIACLVAGVTLMIVPMVVTMTVIRRSPRDLGIGIGDFQFGWKAVAFFSPGFVIATWIGSADPQIQGFYPMPGDSIGDSLPAMVGWFAIYLLYYISFEFFYRGFLLRGLCEPQSRRAVISAIAIQTLCCFIIHIGKPPAEMWASIPASILFGWIAWRSRSIWYPLVIHFLVGIANDLGALWQADALDLF